MERLGPGMWYILHMYPVYLTVKRLGDAQNKMSDVFDLLQSIIPCLTCKQHMTDYNLRNSIHANSNLSLWVRTLHNEVNRRMHKRSLTIGSEYMWCQKSIGGGFDADESLNIGRKLWMGLRFVFAATICEGGVSHGRMGMVGRTKVLEQLVDMCSITFPHQPSRQCFSTFCEAHNRHVTFPNQEGDIDYQRNLDSVRTRESLLALARNVDHCMNLQAPPFERTLSSMMTCSDGGYTEADQSAKVLSTPDATQEGLASTSGGASQATVEELGWLDTDHARFMSILPHLTGTRMDMGEELKRGYYVRRVTPLDTVSGVKRNMWVPADTSVTPFYVDETKLPRGHNIAWNASPLMKRE